MAPLTRGVAAIDSGAALNQEAPTDVSQSVLIAASSATVTLLVIAIVLAGGVFFCLLARRRSGYSSTRFTNAWRVPRIASRQTPQPSTGQSLCDALIHSFFRGASRMKEPNNNNTEVQASSAIVTVDPSAETNSAGGEVEMESAPTSAVVVVKDDDLKESVRI